MSDKASSIDQRPVDSTVGSGGADPIEIATSPPFGSTAHFAKKVRELRNSRNYTLEELAARSGVSRSMLSHIERGEANPTLPVAFRIATVFGVLLDDLVAAPPYEGGIEVVSPEDEAFRVVNEPGYRVRTLSPLHVRDELSVLEVSLSPGRTIESRPHPAGTREFLTLRGGSLEVSVADETRRLKAGESAYYRADVTHAVSSLGPGDAEFLIAGVTVRHR